MNIDSYFITEDKNNSKLELRNLLHRGTLDTLKYSYLNKFIEYDPGICNINWLLDLALPFENLMRYIGKDIKKYFRYDIENKKLRINKNITYYSTILDTIEYTNEQKIAVKKLLKFIMNHEKYVFGLYGYAGTGKTTTMVEFISYLIKNKYIKSVVFTAPTNKAVNVIKLKFRYHLKILIKELFKRDLNNNYDFEECLAFFEANDIIINFMTIHKLLQFKTDYGPTGDTIFIKDSSTKSLIKDYDICIIDECSMIQLDMIDYIFNEIRHNINSNGSDYHKLPKIIFTGDPAQLPPVNEDNSSIFSKTEKDLPFDKYFSRLSYSMNTYVVSDISYILKGKYEFLIKELQIMDYYTLKKVVRSKLNDVTSVCHIIRKWVNSNQAIPNKLKNFLELEDVKFYENFSNINKINSNWFNNFLKSIKNKENSIIITWTNKQTDIYNETIRRSIFNKKNISKFEIGDMLMLTDFYNLDKGEDSINNVLHTSEQVKIKNAKLSLIPLDTMRFSANMSTRKFKWYRKIDDKITMLLDGINNKYCHGISIKSWILSTHRIGEPETNNITIIVVDDNDIDKYKKILEETNTLISSFAKHLLDLVKSSSNQVEKYIIKPIWKEWNRVFKNSFANVNYGYSITCHKAQGSNFYDVYVDINDILQNNKIIEAKKCAYTAVTRTSNRLYLLI